MTSNDNKDRNDDALAAEYALGTLPHGERVSIEKRLLSDEKLSKKVNWWHNQYAPMSKDIDAVTPPARILNTIEQKLFGSQKTHPNWWDSLWLWRTISIASLAGMIVFGGIYFTSRVENLNTQQTVFVGQLSDKNSDLKLAAYYDNATKTLRLNRISGQALPNRSLELWIIPEGQKPISLGILPILANHELKIPTALQAAISSSAVLAITDEPEGGSPTDAPTGVILAAGTVIKI